MAIGRRRFLGAAGACAVLHGCSWSPVTSAPSGSPLRRGRYAVGRARLGITPGTFRPPMPEHVQLTDHPDNTESCATEIVQVRRPSAIDAMVWYPARRESSDIARPIRDALNPRQRYPLILYAHAKRKKITCTELVPDGLDPDLAYYSLDYTRVDDMLSHIASWGFVIVAPDLGWLLALIESGSVEDIDNRDQPHVFPRARILIALHDALLEKSNAWFSDGVNPERLGLFGHSNGATACLGASTRLANTRILGLLAPALEDLAAAQNGHPALVIGGTNDTNEGANPDAVYTRLTGQKFLVKIGGANHLGYTDLCSADNRVCMDQDPAGDIPREVQQETAAAYLTAAARAFLYDDEPMLSYLRDDRPTGAERVLPSIELKSATPI
jgi:dienelactone hydrolase